MCTSKNEIEELLKGVEAVKDYERKRLAVEQERLELAKISVKIGKRVLVLGFSSLAFTLISGGIWFYGEFTR
jgi:hypothetical protein